MKKNEPVSINSIDEYFKQYPKCIEEYYFRQKKKYFVDFLCNFYEIPHVYVLNFEDRGLSKIYREFEVKEAVGVQHSSELQRMTLAKISKKIQKHYEENHLKKK